MKCPRCGTNGVPVFKCNLCGDTRCGSSAITACGGTKGPCNGQRGQQNHPCKACKKGKYNKIS